jgi:hypothetical protein
MASKSCFAAVLKGKNIVDHNTKKKECAQERERELSATAAYMLYTLVRWKSFHTVCTVCSTTYFPPLKESIRRKWNLSSASVARPVADSRAWKFCTLANDFSNFSRPAQSGTEQPFSRKSFFLLSRH